MLAPWLAFGMLSLVVYGAFSDGDFSFLLTYASLTRCFAVTLLVAQLQQSKSASGISSKTLQCYVCVFASRLLSILRHEGYLPYDRSGDWIYHCIEVGAFLATLAALALVHGPYSSTYDITADGFGAPGVPSNLGALVLIVPAFVVALLVHPGLNKDVLSDASWTYAMYLESFAVLPQLYLFQKQAGASRASRRDVWKSNSELGYPCGDIRQPERHRTDAGMETTSWGARNLISTQVVARRKWVSG